MIACGIALTFWGMKRSFTNLEVVLIPLGLCGSTALAIFSFFVSAYAAQNSFIDVPCEETYEIALALIRASAALYLFCAFLVIFELALASQSKRFKNFLETAEFLHISIRGWLNLSFALTEFFLLWTTLALIVFVREYAKRIFGRSYGDDAMGYGQVMAIGFCIQVMFEAGDLALTKYRRASHSPSPEKPATAQSKTKEPSLLKHWIRYRFRTIKDHHLRIESES
jgi:hypothetical protein